MRYRWGVSSIRTNGQLGTGQASWGGHVSAEVERSGTLKGSGEEMGVRGTILLPSEEEIPVSMDRLDMTSWEWLGMISELEYWYLC